MAKGSQEFVMSETATKTRDQVVEELEELIVTLCSNVAALHDEKMAILLSESLAEFVHWVYDSTGKHAPASAIFETLFAAARARESMGGGMTPFNKKPEGHWDA